MSTHLLNCLKPPEVVRGLQELNKDLFEKTLKVCYLHLKDVNLSKVVPVVKKYFMKVENFKPVQNIEGKATYVYLNPEVVSGWSSLPLEITKILEELSVVESDLKTKDHTLTYDNYTADDILKAVLPQEKEGVSSFTKVGHIVHVNLRDHLIPYKTIIGKILYDKVSGCRTVVNKVGMIDNAYRNFQIEILQGENDMITTVKENQCTFKFDFSTIYWNSRLCTEHERIVKTIKPNDVLFDVFAGVGPFSIPVAKKKCFVFANDLNPKSFDWLNYNSKANKLDPKYLTTYNKDGRDFILEDIKQHLPKYLNKKHNIFITMNLPALAVEFLNAFVNLFNENEIAGEILNPPIVYVYCFAKGGDFVKIAKDLVIKNIGFDISDKIIEIFKVRTVSSMKEMMRVSFELDKDILVGRNLQKRKAEEDDSDCLLGNKKCIFFF